MCKAGTCGNCFVERIYSPCADSGQDITIEEDGNFYLGGEDTGQSSEPTIGNDGIGVTNIAYGFVGPGGSDFGHIQDFSDGSQSSYLLPYSYQEFTNVGTLEEAAVIPGSPLAPSKQFKSLVNGLWMNHEIASDDTINWKASYGEPRKVDNLRFQFQATERNNNPDGRTNTSGERQASLQFKYNDSTSTVDTTGGISEDSDYFYYQNVLVNKADVYITWKSPYLMLIDYDIDIQFDTGLEAGDPGLEAGEAGVGAIDFPDYVYELCLGFDQQNVDSGYAYLGNSYPLSGPSNDGLIINDTTTCLYSDAVDPASENIFEKYLSKNIFQVRCGVNESVYSTVGYSTGGIPPGNGSTQLLVTHRYYDGVDFGQTYRFRIKNQVLSNPIEMATDYMTP